MKSEKEKMLSGQNYNGFDAELVEARRQARLVYHQLNNLHPDSLPSDRQYLIQTLVQAPTDANITPPFYCDYGSNIKFGKNVYLNFNCVILDVCQVTIGDNTLLGPNVQIYTPLHPMKAEERLTGLESGKPITIGSNVWIGGGAIVCPGVEIGDNTVIGAGSVVTRNIPSNVFAAGNPCRVIRDL